MEAPNIEGYEVAELLGRGGFASVYRATRLATGETAALKVLFAHATDSGDLKRFDRERRSMSALHGHPNIVSVIDDGNTSDGHHYMALEFIEGGSVRDLLAQSGAMHWVDVTRVGVQICGALSAAHRSGVLHRDVKPANILNHNEVAKLTDFGIARLVGQSQVTAAQSIIGTLAYTPPEILHNKSFDGRGDIYQLGISLYEMLLGRAPFKSGQSDNKAMVIRRILENPAPPLAQFDVPQPLSDLLDEVLAKDPADRPQTADEFGRRLNDVEVTLGRIPTIVGEPIDVIPPDEPTISYQPNRIAAETRPVERSQTSSPSTPQVRHDDRTVVQPSTSGDTLVLDRAADKPPKTSRSRSSEPKPSRRGRWLLVLLLLGSAIAVAAFVTQRLQNANATDDTPDEPVPVIRTMERTGETAFLAPAADVGIIYAAVANTAGLTTVGGLGSTVAAANQNGVVWTWGPDDGWNHRADFAAVDGTSADAQQLRAIAVLDGVNLLAVGRSARDGVAWMGLIAKDMIPLTDDSFTGPGVQELLGAVGDPGNQQFLVVGRAAGDVDPTPGLWILSEGQSEPPWSEPVWTQVPIGGGLPGVLTDVAVAGDLATAVGWERRDSADHGVVLIRRNDVWHTLLTPLANVQFNAVDFFGDRVVAVGTRTIDGVSKPVAVVSDIDGNGLVHNLPIGDTSGQANDVVASAAGVFAVGTTGEVSGENALRNGLTDGALWELVEGDLPEDDRWKTRDTDQLSEAGSQEFWTVVEFEGNLFALGSAAEETGNRDLAAGWTVTAGVGNDSTLDADVTEAQQEAAPEDPPTEIAGGNSALGVAIGGCAAQAGADVHDPTKFNQPDAELTAVLATATDDFAIWICTDESDQLWYHGAGRRTDLSITLRADAVTGGYEAVNGDTVYRVVDGRLTVHDPNGDGSLDEPLV